MLVFDMKKILTLIAGLFLIGSLFAEVTDVTAEQAAAKLKEDAKIVVVDVRTPEEFKEGHIKGAVNIDFKSEDFAEKLGKLDRKKTYLMHCRSGGRSGASFAVWKSLGFEKVLHLKSGALGWEKAGYKFVVPKAEVKK